MKILERVGLTRKEAEIYELLVKLGESPAQVLIRESKTHPQIVYRALDSLNDKGLVFEYAQNSKKYFRAEDPEKLIKLEEEKLSDLKSTVSRLKSIEALSKDALVKISRGNEAVINLRKRAFEELKRGEEYLILGASGDRFYQIVGEENAKIEAKRIKRGVKKRMIAYKSQRKSLLAKEPSWDLVDLRFVSDETHVPSTTNIFKNTVAILILDWNPIVITIESKNVAESYRQYFNFLWNTAKK